MSAREKKIPKHYRFFPRTLEMLDDILAHKTDPEFPWLTPTETKIVEVAISKNWQEIKKLNQKK